MNRDKRAERNCFPQRFWRLAAAASISMCGLFSLLSAQNQIAAHDPPPYWAYVVNPPAEASTKPKPADNSPRHVPGSEAAFTETQLNDLFRAPDWHPADHPGMPDIVSHGRTPDVFACGYCHLPNGQGEPENASLAGLPAGYIVRQLADFKSGRRRGSEPRFGPTNNMIAFETKATGREIQSAAEYFSQLKPRPWIRVVETKTVPQTHVSVWKLVPSEAGEMEPIGQRIIETPENPERTELRDDRSGFIAYVPVGSIQKGKTLVATGGAGKTVQCATCHGGDLKGFGNVPALAGRSPSYIVRQLYDMQSGARTGVGTQKMKPAVTKLTLDDMLSIAAYTASLNP